MASRFLLRRQPAPQTLAPALTRSIVLRACRVAGLGALLLAGTAAVTPTPASAAMFGYGMSAPDVADMLYSRYGVARVMRVVPTGDVFQADAIDRRGFRIHFTVDGYSGEVLESFVMGRTAYEPAVPVPPGLVPGRPAARAYPPQPDDDLGPVEPRRLPAPQQRGRQARNPDPAAPVTPPKVRQTPAPRSAAPVPAAPAPTAPPPSTASRQPAEKPLEPARPATPPTVTPPAQAVKPIAPPSGTGDAQAPEGKAPEVKQAGPPARLPEPLIDPKTGRPSGAVPVAPLESTQPETKAPITIVPPAPLE